MNFHSTDVFANANPALGSLVLWSFCHRYVAKADRGAEHPLIYLPLPLVLSHTFRSTFEGTNTRTGLYAWIERNPELHVDLASSVEGTRQISRGALLFGIRYGLLELREDARIYPNAAYRPSKGRMRTMPEEVRGVLTLAERLGAWVGETASARTVFYTLGITL